ncbi:FMRFamide neuropeptide 6 [Trichostrongylus colubriformis]|uniref:FMRFamide neuropeptide 6 n=1 Tax=Trichostrongylus colubriformis TaxID=6319 RepID=A0AAN8IAK5_TRICO
MLCVVFVLSLVACSFAASSSDDQLSEQFCRQFPSLHLCRLHDTLQGSLVELQYLLQDTNVETAAPGGVMEKRKSAFVRFGKRSSDDAGDVEKRKSAFVRFGRSAPFDMQQKRKSQYIRFGRK